MVHPILFLILLFGAVIFEAGADVLFKYSHLQGKSLYLWIGIALYTVGTVIWAISLKYEYLSKAVSTFTILNLIAVILVGVIFFKEDITLSARMGIGLGIISIFLMQF